MKRCNLNFSGNGFLTIIWSFFTLSLSAQSFAPFALEEYDSDPMMRLANYQLLDSVDWRAAHNVSECRITEHKYKKGVPSEEAVGTAIYKFDAAGYPAEAEFNNGKRRLKSLLDENNKISRGIVFNVGGDTILVRSFEYDSVGRLSRLSIEKKGLKTYVYNIGSINWYYMTNGCQFSFEYRPDNKLSGMKGYTTVLFSEAVDPFYTEEIIYNDQGKVSETNICLRLVSALDELLSRGFSEAECSYKIENFFTADGFPLRSDYYHPDAGLTGMVINNKPQGYFLMETNKEGKITQSGQFDANSKLELRRDYLYDALGNLIQITAYDPYGKITSRVIQSFNEEKQVTMDMSFGADNKLLYMYSYTYDSNGIKTEVIKHNTEDRQPQRLYRIGYK